MMKVSIVIPNFNGEKLLRNNFPAVLNIRGVSEIILVDDGSTDGSVNYLKDELTKNRSMEHKVRIIETGKNIGFSSAVNRGVKETTGDIIVLLNTDVVPEDQFLKPLLPHFDDPKVFAVGCLDRSIEEGKTVLRGRGLGAWKRGFVVHRRGEVDKSDTFWVSGGSGAFRKIIWDNLGGLDEIYNPYYWEDIDLSYRAQKMSYRVLFEDKSIVIHKHEEGSIQQKYSPSQIKIIAYRNQFIFVWKNINDPWLLANHIFWLPYHIFKSMVAFDPAFLKGLLAALLKFPQILKSHRVSKKTSLRSDREILSSFT